MKTVYPSFSRTPVGIRCYRSLCFFAFGLLSLTVARAALPAGWSSQDIFTAGSPPAAGSSSESGGTFTVTGAGSDIFGTADEFQYAYESASGDFTIVARVATEQNTHVWAKSGVMFRESLAANSKYAYLAIAPDSTGDKGIVFEYRTTAGGSAVQNVNVAGVIPPQWLKLVRTGNTFNAYYSGNGTSWTQAGTSVSVPMNGTLSAGLAVCSAVHATTCTATFTNVSLAGPIASPWSTWDIGTPQTIGSSSLSGGTFTVSGSGDNLYNTSDNFRFTYQPFTGDCTVIARVTGESNTNQYAKAGVMIRQSLDANSAYALALITPDQPTGTDRGVLFESRASAGASATQPGNNPALIPPQWLKLVRSSSTFTAFYSSDGATWTSAGSSTTVTMTGTIYVGLAVCASSSTAGALNTATFTDVSIGGDTTAPTATLTMPMAGAFVHGSSVALAAAASDSGGSGLAGVQFKYDTTNNIGSEDTVSPFGATWDTTVVGNGNHTLTAVARDGAGNHGTSAGVTVLVDNASPTIAITAPAAGTVSGSVTATVSAADTGGSGLAGVQYKLDGAAIGSEVTSSPFSFTWDTSLVVNGSHSLTAVARDGAGNTTTSAAVNVTVSNSLPAGWTASDIGVPGTPGTTNYSAGTYFVDGAGTNIWGTADEFQFTRQSINGDCTVIARVTNVDPTATWSKAGIMIRELNTDTSKYVLLAMTPTRGLLFEARTGTTAPDNSSIQPGTVSTATVPQWLKLVRTGNVFAAYYSTDGVSWSNTGLASPTVTVPMATAVYAGLAVCSTVHGTLCTATFENVSATVNPAYNPAFPRLGIYPIGGDQSYPMTVWPMLAKFNVVFMSGSWEGWASGKTYTREQMVSSIKSTSTVGTKIFQYVLFESVWNYSTPIGNVWNPTWRTIADNNNWWLWINGTSGNHAISDYNANMWVINQTHASPTDSNGLYPFQSAAQYSYDMFIGGAYNGGAAPSLDGFYLDNVFWQPRARDPGNPDGGDWDRSGSKDLNTDPTVRTNYRTGQKDFFDKMVSLMPGKMQAGNIADWPQAAEPGLTDLTAIAPLNGLLNGGLLEGAIGKASSVETWHTGGTTALMAYYKYSMDALASPKLMVLEQSYLGPFTSSDPNVPAVTHAGADRYDDAVPYRAMRYGLCCTLMGDGYYSGRGKVATATLSDIQWYDEYDNKGASPGYLGHPLTTAQGNVQTAPTTGNIWRRDFDNGIVLMIEKGATVPQTINLNPPAGVHYKRLGGTAGWQDPSTNNGATNVTSVTFTSPRDGLILLKY